MVDLESHKVVGVLSYAAAAVFGVVAANYVEAYSGASVGNPFMLIVGGAVGLALPIWVIKDNTGMMGPVRLFFGVLGLTLIVRGIIGVNGIYPIAALSSPVRSSRSIKLMRKINTPLLERSNPL